MDKTYLCDRIDRFTEQYQWLKDLDNRLDIFNEDVDPDIKINAVTTAKSMIGLSHIIWQMRTTVPELEESMADNIKQYDLIVYVAVGLACDVISAFDTTGRHASINH